MRETKAEMEQRFEKIIDNINRAERLKEKQAEAYWDIELFEYELKIARLEGQIIVYREVLGLNKEHIIEQINKDGEEEHDADK